MIVRELVTLLGFQSDLSGARQYNQQIDRAKVNGSRLSDGFGNIASVAKYAIAGIATGAVMGLGKAMADMGGNLEATTAAFTVLLGGNEEAAKSLLATLQQMADTSPYESSDLQQATKTMMNFNMTSQASLATLTAISDIAMGDAQKMQSLARAMGKVSSAGRMQGEELNMMIDAGFNPLQVMAKQTGKDMTTLRKEMEKGAITADMVANAFQAATGPGGQFYQMSAKISQTWPGLVSTFTDFIHGIQRDVGTALLPDLKDMLRYATEFLTVNRELITSGITGFFGDLLFVMGFVSAMFSYMYTSAKKSGMLDFLLNLVGSLKDMGAFALTLVGSGLIGFFDALNSPDAVKTLSEVLKVFQDIAKAVFGDGKDQSFANFIRELGKFSAAMLITGLKEVKNILEALLPMFQTVGAIIQQVSDFNGPKATVARIISASQFDPSNPINAAARNKRQNRPGTWDFDPGATAGAVASSLTKEALPRLLADLEKEGLGGAKLKEGLLYGMNELRGQMNVRSGLSGNFAQFAIPEFTDQQIMAWMAKQGRSFAKGTNYVPSDGLAYVHRGEKITPAGLNMRNGGGSTLNVQASIQVSVPNGTPEYQKEILKQTAAQAVEEAWQRILRGASAATPLIEKGVGGPQ